MNRLTLVLVAALIASLALDVYLWPRDRAAVRVDIERHDAVEHEDHAPAQVDDPACDRDLVAATAQLADVRKRLDAVLRPDQKFELGEPAEALEKRLHDRIATSFEGAPQGTTWELECRGAVCNIEVFQREETPGDWWDRLQRNQKLAPISVSQSFGIDPVGARDPVSRERLHGFHVYIELSDPDGVLEQIADAFDAAGAAKQCASNRDASAAMIKLTLEPGDRRIKAELDPNEHSRFATCAYEAVAAYVAPIAPPAVSRGATINLFVEAAR